MTISCPTPRRWPDICCSLDQLERASDNSNAIAATRCHISDKAQRPPQNSIAPRWAGWINLPKKVLPLIDAFDPHETLDAPASFQKLTR